MAGEAETNQPNTLDGCSDGNSGTYLTIGESIEKLVAGSAGPPKSCKEARLYQDRGHSS